MNRNRSALPFGGTSLFQQILGRVAAGEDLTQDEMSAAITHTIQGSCSDHEIGLLLMALRTKGETAAEVAGAAVAIRQHMSPIRSSHQGLIDTCGTGGDHSGTFNISTAAALVVAAAGTPVAKHGNRGISSKSGSADVLRELGVNVNATVSQVENCLTQIGIGFCFAPLLHPAMKSVAQIRKQLGVPTIFNWLGPLCNPAQAPYQLLGVGKPEIRTLIADVLFHLGTRRAAVVCGEDGLDEVTLDGRTFVSLTTSSGITSLEFRPEDFGLQPASLDALRVEGPEQSAELIQEVLAGRKGPARDIVVLNAAAALWVAERDPNQVTCAQKAQAAIDSGKAKHTLEQLVKFSQMDEPT